jgi:hypothetical protein
MRKLLDVSALRTRGWVAQTALETGIAAAYASYLAPRNE